MIRKLLHWLTGYLPLRIIHAETSVTDPTQVPLFERYYLFSLFGVTAYIHHYLRSDPDRGWHNHPWGWAIAWPLVHGYLEQRAKFLDAPPGTRGMRIRTWFNARKPPVPYVLTDKDFHKVIIPYDNVTSWSLFIHGPKKQTWGMIRPAGGGRVEYAAFSDGEAEKRDGKFVSRRWWDVCPAGRFVVRHDP